VRGARNDVVLVDTGSPTVPWIARSFGARLFHLAWTGPTSALARHFALPRATGDWILSIDEPTIGKCVREINYSLLL